MQKEHVLKIADLAWQAIERGEKPFEVRRNDRFFQRGDIVVLRRCDDKGFYIPPPGCSFGTQDLRRRIGWMLQGGQYGIEPGYCVFTLEPENTPADPA